ncbi:FHA domain-containing protein [Paenibacillus sp. sptzw28]|uniref:DUF6382 domain-containing protein n=1 Tax=Paenibacillus sp. sptzw28 TaxID=715179 RepID=UPI001C6DDDE9|nr:DUF6382 domain-containing protein [Paenibacillus sp. sptzw28]QYR20669.1 FHA domain-containing protein [Paenibacillus sp. sptzw28]
MLLETLRIDFSLNRGHEMIIDRETGITRDQLEEVEIHMLQGQRVPKLLDVEWIDIDGFVTFRYSLTGRRMLSHKLQSQQMTMNDFYTLLLAIVEALDDCQHYMLRAAGFMLQEQYIFVGEDWDDIGLVYVPLRREGPASSAEEAVMTMAVRWIGYISQPDGAGLQQVFRHLRGEHVSWHDLRQKLLTLLNSPYMQGASPSTPAFNGESRANSSAAPVNNWQSNHWHSEFGGQGSAARKEQIPGQLDKSVQIVPSIVLPFRKRQADTIAPASKEDAEQKPVNRLEDELPIVPIIGDKPDGGHSRKRWLLGAGLILAIALIWRYLYLSSPTQTSLLISLGLTVLAVAGLLIYLRRESSDEDVQEDVWRSGKAWAAEEDGFVPDSTILSQGKAAAVFEKQSRTFKQTGAEQLLTEQKAAHFQTYDNPNVSSGLSHIVPARHQSETMNRQERMHASDPQQAPTVLLGDDSNNRGHGGELLPWLERETEGKVERLSLRTDRFVVGRSAEGAHYVDSASGISRAHVELTCAAECWTAKDVGSRNGSTLNGQTMIPYKAYALTNGDILQLAGEKGPKFTFRAG